MIRSLWMCVELVFALILAVVVTRPQAQPHAWRAAPTLEPVRYSGDHATDGVAFKRGNTGHKLVHAVKFNEDRHARWNGARLILQGPAITGTGERRRFSVEWAIDYTGPRPPLTVLAPALGESARGGTVLWFYWEPEEGKSRWFAVRSPPAADPARVTRDDFRTADGGEPITGSFVVPVAKLMEVSGRTADFGPDDLLYVQLEHDANDRGLFEPADGKPDLDAWTGLLYSNVPRVSIGD